METTKTTTSLSNIRVYTHGYVDARSECGAYAYIVLSGKLPREPLNCFAQAGKTTDVMRMKMRAIYEGVRHCPDGVSVEIYLGDTLLTPVLETATGADFNADIAERYRRYIGEHRITPVFVQTKMYSDNDLPSNDHDEWVWYAHRLCEEAIEKHLKEQKL